ncbi:hypothetical protein [Phaeocystidibacter luteus]|uniref:Lipoprotein n=1 Tax=Phaeocystidibacter luteus TaxID=911197 RepID=A0A6N6RF95_9FLAO|nr:hypothetical protein [Phaeocystidibacter luteus]KAB2809820.1 hypothetical protein F8C67_09715 [Phaeocystidibacter luteus]
MRKTILIPLFIGIITSSCDDSGSTGEARVQQDISLKETPCDSLLAVWGSDPSGCDSLKSLPLLNRIIKECDLYGKSEAEVVQLLGAPYKRIPPKGNRIDSITFFHTSSLYLMNSRCDSQGKADLNADLEELSIMYSGGLLLDTSVGYTIH